MWLKQYENRFVKKLTAISAATKEWRIMFPDKQHHCVLQILFLLIFEFTAWLLRIHPWNITWRKSLFLRHSLNFSLKFFSMRSHFMRMSPRFRNIFLDRVKLRLRCFREKKRFCMIYLRRLAIIGEVNYFLNELRMQRCFHIP